MFAKQFRFSFKNKLPKNTLNSQSFSVRYEKNEEGLRVAVVVSKKVDKRAVIRNKIKRKILAAVRKEIETSAPINLVFYAKQGAASVENLENEVQDAIKKINHV